MKALTLLIQWIINNKFATTEDKDVFRNYIPDNPNELIGIMEYQGSGPHPQENTSTHSLQVFVRGGINTEKKIWDIYNKMQESSPFISDGLYTCVFTTRSTPCKVNQDTRGRVEWVFNIAMTIQN